VLFNHYFGFHIFPLTKPFTFLFFCKFSNKDQIMPHCFYPTACDTRFPPNLSCLTWTDPCPVPASFLSGKKTTTTLHSNVNVLPCYKNNYMIMFTHCCSNIMHYVVDIFISCCVLFQLDIIIRLVMTY